MSTAITAALLNGIEKLNSYNWFTWKKDAKMMLMREGCWEVVAAAEGVKTTKVMPKEDDKGYESWISKEVQALSTIFFLTDSTLQYHIDECDYASTAWKKLKDEFEGNTRSRRYEIRNRFNKPVHKLDRPIEEYIQGVLQARKELQALGCSIDDTETADMIIMNLNPAFETVRTTLIARDKEPTLIELQAILKEADRDLKKDEEVSPAGETALAARRVGGDWRRGATSGRSHGHGHGHRDREVRKSRSREDLGSGKGSSGNSRASGFKCNRGYRWCDTTNDNHCHRCGQTGHIAARCVTKMPPEVVAWIFDSTSRSNSPTQDERVHSVRIEEDPDLYYDSGE